MRSLVVVLDEERALEEAPRGFATPVVRPFARRHWVNFLMCWPPELEVDAFTGLRVYNTFQVGPTRGSLTCRGSP